MKHKSAQPSFLLRPSFPGTRWKDVAAALLLALLTVAFFWRTLTGDVYQPADGGDLVSFLYPTYRFAAAALARGELPLWNPTLYGGAPFIADIQAGFLYPPNLLLFWLQPDFGYVWMQWLSIGHLWWAGLGVYALCRVLGISRPGALFAGSAFAFSDPLLIHLGNLNLIGVLSWLGWVLAAFHLALQRRSLAWAGAAGLLFALATYAGHAQSSYYLGLAVVVYWGLGSRDWGLGIGRWLWSLRFPLVTALVAGLLAAPILLPSLELLPFTARAALAYQENVSYSLAPVPGLVGLITPGFFGRGPALHWSLWDRVELPYAGVVALLLGLAVFFLPLEEKRRKLLPWVGLALFGLLVALGVYAPVHGWLTQLLPGFDSFRAPARAIVLWTFSLAILAGYGVDRVSGGVRDGGKAAPYAAFLKWGGLALLLLFTPALYASLLALQTDSVWFLRASLAGLAVALATLAWLGVWGLVALRQREQISGRVAAALLTGLLLVEVAATGAYTDISEGDPARGFHHPEIVEFLRSEWNAAQDGSGSSTPFPPFRIDARTGIDDLWQPDSAALVGLRDVWGIVNPLLLLHWERLWESTGGRQTRLYDMLNAGYVLVRDGTPLPEKFLLAFDAPGELMVYRNPDALPRAWLVTDSLSVPDPDGALAALLQPNFDPARSVILLTPELENGAGGQEARAVAVSAARYTNAYLFSHPSLPLPIPEREVDRLLPHSGGGWVGVSSYTVTSPAPGYLVISESWYPGWVAVVNGQEQPVLRANYALQAVAVPAGEVSVALHFRPESWRRGLWLAGLGGVFLLTLCIPRPLSRRNR